MRSWGVADSDILSLDPRIRNYVLIPISIIVLMQGILRHYVNILLQDRPRKPKRDEVKHGELLRRSKLLRTNGCVLMETSFHTRRFSYIKTLSDYVQELTPKQQAEDPNAMPQMPMQNPEELQSMIGMMKQNMANLVPNMLSMAWISYFFSGFVLVKLPFPLTESFKSMLQQGISIVNLDPSYVSSLSWYFINLFGTRGILSLVLDQYNVNEIQSMYPQMAILPSAPGGTAGPASGPLKQEPQKPFEQEKVELEICKFRSVVAGAEYRILGKEIPRAHNE